MAVPKRTYYTAQDVEVLYLDDEPKLAAEYCPDQLVERGLICALKLLSQVHITKGAATLDWGATNYFDRLPGDYFPSLHAFLGKSRIYPGVPQSAHNHAHVVWVMAYGGNYLWLKNYAAELYRRGVINGVFKSLEWPHLLQVLAKPPESQLYTVNTWCEPLFVGPEELRHESTSEAYRGLIAAQYEKYTWTPSIPEWMGEKHYTLFQQP
jgi:hypothetical protein